MPQLSKLVIASLTFAVLYLGSVTMASADTVTFTGTRFSQNTPGSPMGRCAPALTVVNSPAVGTSTGTSNLGAFTPTQSHCITPPLPTAFSNGLFTWAFANGATLSGTYFGNVTASVTPGVFNEVENYTITGGTGIFAGASGNILGNGTLVFPPDNLPFINVNLSGTITAPGLTAVPEPDTMLLLVTGLAGVGTLVRRRFSIDKSEEGFTR